MLARPVGLAAMRHCHLPRLPAFGLAARSPDPALVERERGRFLRALQPVLAHRGPRIVVTDSQVGTPGGGRGQP